MTRWVLSIVAAALTAGAMAAGAWALTSSDDVPAAPAKRPAVHRLQSDAAYSGERPCGRKHRSEAAKASVRY